MLLAVEPTKPHLCNDYPFLNIWIKDNPFNLDSITALTCQFVTTSQVMTMFLFLPPVATFFAFNWPGGTLLVKQSHSHGNP